MLPSSPIDGQKYNNLEWSDSVGGWVKSDDLEYNTIRATKNPAFSGIGNSNHITMAGYYKPTVIQINEDSCFNQSTGLYTVPIEGSYLCSSDFLLRTSDSSAAHAAMYFEKNGTYKSGQIHSMHDIVRPYEPISLTVIIYAEVGDTIGLFITTPSAQMYATNYSRLCFTLLG